MKYLSFFSLLLFGIIILATSCKKDDLINKDLEIKSRTTINDIPNINMPSVIDDRYHFQDFDHLTEVYLKLDELSKATDDFEEHVNNLSSIENVYQLLNNQSFEDPNQAYSPFLTDPIMRILVNRYFEFQVGDKLVTYMNNKELLLSDPNDLETRGKIREMVKGIPLDYEKVPENAIVTNDHEKENLLRPWCGCDISVEQIGCDSVRIFGNCRNAVWGRGSGTVQIFMESSGFFPPSGSTPFVQFDIKGNFSFTLAAPSFPRPLFVHASVKSGCSGSIELASIEFGTSCDFNERDSGFLWKNDNFSQAIRHRTSYYRNFWSTYEDAEIWAYIRNSHTSTDWHPAKGRLDVWIDATRRNGVCNVFEVEDDHDWCSNCHYKDVRVNTGVFGAGRDLHHCDGDVIGTFKRQFNWQGSSWSIDDSHSLDFDCCP